MNARLREMSMRETQQKDHLFPTERLFGKKKIFPFFPFAFLRRLVVDCVSATENIHLRGNWSTEKRFNYSHLSVSKQNIIGEFGRGCHLLWCLALHLSEALRKTF